MTSMLTRSPVTENIPDRGGKDQKFGPCQLIVGEDDVLDELIICNKPGHDEVLVRNPFGLFIVTLCIECKKDHFDFYQDRKRERAKAYEERLAKRTKVSPNPQSQILGSDASNVVNSITFLDFSGLPATGRPV